LPPLSCRVAHVHLALVAAPLPCGWDSAPYWSARRALLDAGASPPRSAGQDFVLINMAYNLPLVVAPLAAGVVLGRMNSYAALFALCRVVTIVAA